MASLEDKILGEKLECYCSSSEDEDEKFVSGDEGKDDEKDVAESSRGCSFGGERPVSSPDTWTGTSTNTGPKGVIKDFQRFKQLETEKRTEQERERLQLIQKLSLTCQSVLDEQKNKENDDEVDSELSELLADSFLLQYQEKRMHEMMDQYNRLPSFGKLITLKDAKEFLEAIDNEVKAVTVVVHIYENNIPGCEAMNGCLTCLSEEFPKVKFCRLFSSVAGMSKRFKMGGLPALLVYKGGQLVGNFVRVTDDLGTDFFAEDVESFLSAHGVLPDKSCIPKIIQQSKTSNESDDDD